MSSQCALANPVGPDVLVRASDLGEPTVDRLAEREALAAFGAHAGRFPFGDLAVGVLGQLTSSGEADSRIGAKAELEPPSLARDAHDPSTGEHVLLRGADAQKEADGAGDGRVAELSRFDVDVT